jgi:hypothetical protein
MAADVFFNRRAHAVYTNVWPAGRSFGETDLKVNVTKWLDQQDVVNIIIIFPTLSVWNSNISTRTFRIQTQNSILYKRSRKLKQSCMHWEKNVTHAHAVPVCSFPKNI